MLAIHTQPLQTRCMPRGRRPQLRSALAVAATLTLPALLAGCGGSDVVTAGDVTVLVGERSQEGMEALLSGRLAVLDGCLGLESEDEVASYVVVWPHGTEVVDEDPLTISVPDDGEHSVGDRLQVGGGETAPSGRPGGVDVEAECPGAAVWLAHG